MSEHKGWIGVDLDGTLAHYDGWQGIEHIGEPVPAMAERVQQWLSEGKDVRIFTARVSVNGERSNFEAQAACNYISAWCFRVFGRELPVTNVKDFGMVELWDDRAVQVVTNTGQIMGGPPCPKCGENAIASMRRGEELIGIGCFMCHFALWRP